MDDNENDQENKRGKERSPSPAIKSTAVVKYTSVQSPVDYARLQCNTDLNLPPSNWGSAIDSYGLKQILTRGTGLSSFRMAHMFPDCVGEVDVISGAECIKKLLKLPYRPNGTVSMMVHRVENTLLLDDFDVYDYLMKSEWSWLKDFFYENILKTMSERGRLTLTIENKASSSLQLTSKFLFHSVASLPDPAKDRREPVTAPMCLEGPFLPEPEVRAQSPPNEHLYNRNVLWTFEDIQMLIGSDLPIFGGDDRPCVSLRLRDAREPINVLTGIDYWLDNLMCNVPEVLMCYHLDGIVQKYEPMKTEEIPNLENSKFSPKVVRNVAQNILSFLKSNATKAGHTYWLFKGPDDDVVKLYDLTSLCPDSMDNPFTTPVAMLLYRVARNMRLTNRNKHVKELLENAIQLLKVERYPQIVASSHYMLADLYVPAETNPACPDFKDESSSESDGEEEIPFSEGGDSGSLVQMTGLALRDIGDRARRDDTGDKRKLGKASALGDPAERCGRALKHALRGLTALAMLTSHKCKEEERERLKQQILIEEQHPKMANPCEPIKMNYEPLAKAEAKRKEPKEHQSRRRKRRERKASEKSNNLVIESKPSNDTIEYIDNIDKNAISVRKQTKLFPTWHEPSRDDNFAWKLHIKTLLYEKICLVYATLAEYSYSNQQYGFSLKYIDLASKCQKLLSNMIIKSKVVDASCLIGRVGDNYFQLSKHWSALEQFKKQFETDHDVDRRIRMEIEKDLVEEVDELSDGDGFDLDVSMPESCVHAMEAAVEAYTRGVRVAGAERRAELLRRQASVRNELGVRHMNEAQQIYVKYLDEIEDTEDHTTAKVYLKQFRNHSKKSWDCLNEAAEIFEKVNDVPNLALLYCNKGRYMRFKAHCSKGLSSLERRSLYKSAEELYEQALSVLGDRGGAEGPGSAVRELVCWELSCHSYTRAALMQDRPRVHDAEVNEVSEALKHALKHCQLSPGPRQYLYQFRAAMIYHRLGSLYHSQYRVNQSEGPKRRAQYAATRSHYEMASHMFAALEDAAMFLTVQMEHVALLEMHSTVSSNTKLKSLQLALQLLTHGRSIMKLIKEKDPEESLKDIREESGEDKAIVSEQGLLALFESRLHFILKNIIQYCRTKSNKDYEKLTDMYKKLYCASLRIKKDDDVRLYAASIYDVLGAMEEITKNFE